MIVKILGEKCSVRFRLYLRLREVYQILHYEDCSILNLADRLFLGVSD